jgi:quercetin dioxygenase-like cupin family protein
VTEEAFILSPGAGSKVLLRGGTEVTFKAAGQRSAGGPTVLEFKVAPGFSTGDHVHGRIEELAYVLEGEFNIRAGDRVLQATPGDFVAIPPGVAHSIGNAGSGPATLLAIITPAGVVGFPEKYFEELGEILAKPGPPDAAAIAELRRRYDTTQVSPLRT